MSKRKQNEGESLKKSNDGRSDITESSSDSDVDMVDVDFEWFDPQPKYDFHGIKNLLRQLFDVDAQCFDLTALTELILSQPLLGSTVKVDGNETDPYSFLTVLNLQQHRNVPVITTLTKYLAAQVTQNDALASLPGLLDPANSSAQVGLILTDRLMNVPSDIVPPMYKMLLEEISWAVEEKEPYEFSHYLIFSKTYREVASKLDDEDESTRKHKKQKQKSTNGMSDVFYFHPEDQILHRFAEGHATLSYKGKAGESDSKRAFHELGILPAPHLILIKASNFPVAVAGLSEYHNQR